MLNQQQVSQCICSLKYHINLLILMPIKIHLHNHIVDQVVVVALFQYQYAVIAQNAAVVVKDVVN